MNWEVAGVVAEIVGATAVVITLIYVSVQIRLSRLASQIESSYTTVEIYATWRSHLIENGEIAAIVAKANRGEPLEPDEDIRIATLMDDLFVTTAISHAGGVSADVFYDPLSEVRYIERIFRQNPGLAPYWPRSKEYMDKALPSFSAALDSHLSGMSFPLLRAQQ